MMGVRTRSVGCPDKSGQKLKAAGIDASTSLVVGEEVGLLLFPKPVYVETRLARKPCGAAQAG